MFFLITGLTSSPFHCSVQSSILIAWENIISSREISTGSGFIFVKLTPSKAIDKSLSKRSFFKTVLSPPLPGNKTLFFVHIVNWPGRLTISKSLKLTSAPSGFGNAFELIFIISSDAFITSNLPMYVLSLFKIKKGTPGRSFFK